jgi:F1F0 ATPase subunit 2
MTAVLLDVVPGVVLGVGLGVVLGVVVFGGLWATTSKLGTARRPAVLVVGSAIVRFGVVIVGLVGLARFDPVALVSAVGAMVLVRSALVRIALAGRVGGRPGTLAASPEVDR